MKDTFKEFHAFVSAHNNLRVCILDNNNVQFCMHHEKYFPVNQIYEYYDLIIVPGWVHAEITQSDHRSQYISSIPKPLFLLDEVTDYLPFLEYNDVRLMKVFSNAAPPRSKPHRYLKRQLSSIENNFQDISDDWIEEYYTEGFDTKVTSQGDLKKNAGEISILTLAFLLLHYYGKKIKQIAISSSDRGVLDIKRNILDFTSKDQLLNVPIANPISFLSTDVLLAQAYKLDTINESILSRLRTNSKYVIGSTVNEDGSAFSVERVMDTADFLDMLKGENPYSIVF